MNRYPRNLGNTQKNLTSSTFPLVAMVFQLRVVSYAHIHGSEDHKAAGVEILRG
jgi:hypothetical protein